MGRLSPKDIRDQEFKQSPLGFSKDQVNQFLGEIADELEALIQESNAIHVENKEALLALTTYRNVEESLKETLLLAQKTAQDTLKNAHSEAETILRQANTEKEAQLFDAREKLTQIQKEIRRLQARRDLVLLKLKRHLQLDLDALEDEFPDKEDDQDSFSRKSASHDERIVDFSKNDLIMEDMDQESNAPEINIPDAEDFSRE
ncbi:MAG: DivIVA domain-containing protein [Candidatus Marinimicrobia bacterium]|nr:DivIVA domain-containing protein [Candidatus Neomarinimicrobiota bacterium]